jgi:uncharacterized protein YndB with AHSA1/START domain
VPRTDRASRVVGAPPEVVFAALVDPGAVAAWLPPGEMTGTIERFDARPGGSYRMVLRYADGSGSPGKTTADADVVEGQFLEIVPGARLVQAVTFVADDQAFGGTMTMTWQLRAVEGGTRVEITADDVPDGVSVADHAAGMASSLEQLARYLAG